MAYKKVVKVVTLCSGIGAPEVALKRIGIKHTVKMICEIDPEVMKTYNANHKYQKYFPDVRKIKKKQIKKVKADIVIFGAPCQAFSYAGHRQGLIDPRGKIFPQCIRIVKWLKPSYVVIENVEGILSQDSGNVFNAIMDELKKAKYVAYYKVLNSLDYGVPQSRKRIYIVGIRQGINKNFQFMNGTLKTKNLKSLLFQKVDQKYYATSAFLAKQKVQKRLNAYNYNYVPCITGTIARNGTSKEYINMVAAVSRAIGQLRKPSPRECARLHGFPDTFVLPNNVSTTALYHQFANTMTIPILEDILDKLLN
jgi:DNA (cytosine-5)-methyltransferase 1